MMEVLIISLTFGAVFVFTPPELLGGLSGRRSLLGYFKLPHHARLLYLTCAALVHLDTQAYADLRPRLAPDPVPVVPQQDLLPHQRRTISTGCPVDEFLCRTRVLALAPPPLTSGHQTCRQQRPLCISSPPMPRRRWWRPLLRPRQPHACGHPRADPFGDAELGCALR